MVELVHLVVLLVLLAVLRVHEEVEELVREEVVEELVLEVGEVLVQEEQVPPARLYIKTPDQPLSGGPILDNIQDIISNIEFIKLYIL